MPTDSQIHTNRINRLAEAKAVSTPHATEHGLCAGLRVLSNENQQEFDELIAEHHRAFAPINVHEQFLVEEMAQARWRLARIHRLKAAMIDQMIGPAAELIINSAGPFETLQRYAAAAERSFDRALKELQAGRRQGASETEKPAARNKPRSRPRSTSGHTNEALPTRKDPLSDGGWKM